METIISEIILPNSNDGVFFANANYIASDPVGLFDNQFVGKPCDDRLQSMMAERGFDQIIFFASTNSDRTNFAFDIPEDKKNMVAIGSGVGWVIEIPPIRNQVKPHISLAVSPTACDFPFNLSNLPLPDTFNGKRRIMVFKDHERGYEK